MSSISSVGGGYQFLPPVIRPDAQSTSGSSADSSRAGTVAPKPVVAAPAVAASAAPVEPVSAGKHLLHIVV